MIRTDAMPDGGVITLRSVDVTRENDAERQNHILEGEYVRISVTDTGVGIPPEITDRIFEPLYTTKGVNGSGLGLAIVQDAVKSCHGHIDYRSVPGKGTTFDPYFPVAAGNTQDEQEIREAAQASARARKGTVLIVDDEQGIKNVLGDALRSEGYTVFTAASGQQGIEQFDKHAPDIVLTDVLMRNGTGLDLAQYIRKHHSQRTRIYVMTGYSDDNTIAKLKEQGADHVLSKPFSIDDLLMRIAESH